MYASFGPWIVERPIGRGGAATVYRCHHARQEGLRAAVKVLHTRDGGALSSSRLARELRVLRRLDHPGIVGVLDADLDAREPWLALELVEGGSLDRVRPGARPADEVARLARDLTRALVHAHRLGVWHRDVKPANVLVAQRDGQVRLVDFGIAAATDEASLTETGDLPGTASYAPPEWFSGTVRAVPAALDAYALGVVLFEQLTGTRAFVSRTGERLTSILRAKAATAELDPGDGAPAALRDVVRRLTRSVRADRATLEEVLPVLEADGELPGPRPAAIARPPLEPADRFVGREAEVRRLVQLLAESRLVVVVGPPGVGKSRLLRRHLEGVPDGVVVGLGDAGDAAGFDAAWDAALPAGLAGVGRVLLDDADEVLDVIRTRAPAWLREQPALSVVVTSRQGLRTSGARVLELGPLGADEGVVLLEARLSEAGVELPPREVAAALVAAADALPLAVELVAARAAGVPAAELLVGLSGGGGDLLDGLLRESWDRLPEPHRRVLAGCSVFAAGFDLDAAERVLGQADAEPPLFEVLQDLVDRHLLGVRRGEGAFSWLRTVRSFAGHRLDELGRRPVLASRHAAEIARRLEEHRRRGTAPPAVLRSEVPLALDTATRAGDLALVGALSRATDGTGDVVGTRGT